VRGRCSSWNGEVDRLQRDGYVVRAIDNPVRGLTNDAAGNPNVKALVYAGPGSKSAKSRVILKIGRDPDMAGDSLAEPDDFGSLVDLAVQRILVSDEVAATKFRSGAPVEDLLRERQVLAEAGRRAAQLGLDQELAIRFVRSQIYASKIVQSGLLARWQAHPEQAPSTTPDLQSIRERLDQLDEQLLEQLRCARATHRLASLCRRLRELRIPVAAAHHLDALHHRALIPATEWPCSAE
jgi:chorismate mutase